MALAAIDDLVDSREDVRSTIVDTFEEGKEAAEELGTEIERSRARLRSLGDAALSGLGRLTEQLTGVDVVGFVEDIGAAFAGDFTGIINRAVDFAAELFDLFTDDVVEQAQRAADAWAETAREIRDGIAELQQDLNLFDSTLGQLFRQFEGLLTSDLRSDRAAIDDQRAEAARDLERALRDDIITLEEYEQRIEELNAWYAEQVTVIDQEIAAIQETIFLRQAEAAGLSEAETQLGLLALQARNGTLSIAELEAAINDLVERRGSVAEDISQQEFLAAVADARAAHERDEAERIRRREENAGPLGFLDRFFQDVFGGESSAYRRMPFEETQEYQDLREAWRETFGDPVPFQHGGVVTRPTLALIGEAGPEAVVPLDRGLAPSQVVVNLRVDGNLVAQDNLLDEVTRATELAIARSAR